MSNPDRFRFLATFVAGRSIEVAQAPAGEAAYTTGQVVFVTEGSRSAQRREVILQCALLQAGSLDRQLVKQLRARPALTRRYLAIEGRRALAQLKPRFPLAAAFALDTEPRTTSAAQSLEVAASRVRIANPPAWFGVIRPSRLLAAPNGGGAAASDGDLRLQVEVPSTDDPDDEPSEQSKILKLFEVPVPGSQTVADFLRKLFGSPRSMGRNQTGSELRVGSARQVHDVGPHARPLPTRIHFTDERPGAAGGVRGVRHPEWDVFDNRYRPDWCRVVNFPLTVAADVAAAGVTRDDVLRRRLSRVGLGPKLLRRRADGDELDIAALIDLTIDLRSGYSPPEHVYQERRSLARDLGVLILLDASGSATDTDPEGLAVHEHQRRAAATLAATLEELGDRVAVYAFRSQSRHAVHLMGLKAFDRRFGVAEQARLNQLQPGGYTRLGAGIRGAGDLLMTDAGTPNRLLLVLSDGFPYDDGGYEGRYAEADTLKALDELRADGIACLCLSLGGANTADTLARVFGSAGYASASTLAELSPRMDELFVAALRDVTTPR